MKKNTVAGYIVQTLLQQNFTDFYCIPGVQNDDFFDALYDYQDSLPPIVARHEQGSAYMALGAAMATGKPQIFCIVPGPGFLNSTTALATAYSTNAPVIALIGQIPSAAIDKDIGLLHEIPEQTTILSVLTKKTVSIRSGKTAKQDIADAFIAIKSGVPRPVGIEIPINVWNQTIGDIDINKDLSPLPHPKIDNSCIKSALQLIQNAKSPLIFVGSGAQHASDEITAFAEKIHAPVAYNRMGHGVMSARNPLSINTPVAHALWADVDLVIGLGSRLQPCWQWGMDTHIKSIQVELNPDRIDNLHTADVAIHGDCQEFCTHILHHIPHQDDTCDWQGQVAIQKQLFSAKIHTDLAPQLSFIQAIRTVLPDDGIYVEDLTQVGYVARFAYPTYKPRTFISHGYQGTLGWSIATALGVAHARRDVPVISISGDGGFAFTMPELATAIHHNIPLNMIVFNDNAFGNVKRFQMENYNNRAIASDLTNPDFVQLVQSYGIPSTRVSTAEQLEQQLHKNIAVNTPTFIEVSVGEMPSPWEHILLGKVRG